ncbi:MAG: shikimate kinase, partial [Flavobacteriales bacterium]
MKIYLIGYMASGKTTRGKELAQDLNLPLLDLDELLVARSG